MREYRLCYGRVAPPESSSGRLRRYSPKIIAQKILVCLGFPTKVGKIKKIFSAALLDVVVVNAEGDFEDRREELFSAHCFCLLLSLRR